MNWSKGGHLSLLIEADACKPVQVGFHTFV